jgi:branched-chain amino acid aminotransferase
LPKGKWLFVMTKFVCFNGSMYAADTPLLTVQNSGYKYGDGVFETMKMVNGRLTLADLHFQRLFNSLKLLEISYAFDASILQRHIETLCNQNACNELGRIRLSVFRDGEAAGFAIEATSVPTEVNSWNERGWNLGLFANATKTKDEISNLKTANFLPYVLAGRHAEKNNEDDAIVLNTEGLVCDTSRANIFLVKNGKLTTPALEQGCVAGVMRKYLIEKLRQTSNTVCETEVHVQDILNSDEVFISNAVFGMRWVKQFQNKEFGHSITQQLYEQFIAPLFSTAKK